MTPTFKHAILAVMVAACFDTAPALAQTQPDPPTAVVQRLAPAAPSGIGTIAADGRLLGHLPYAEGPAADIVPVASPGFAIGGTCRLQRDAAADLLRLIDAANATPSVAHQLRGVSCYRSIAYQRSVFCRGGSSESCGNAGARAISVAPPGFSEHGTGYAIDFGLRPSPNCRDLEYCMASTAVGLWLIAHARDFGFELSFPAGNAQQVTWEPWHWRWVGKTASSPGAAKARAIFARARAQFPARPMIAGPVIQTVHAKPSPRILPIPVFWPGVYF